jgi:integrative and conjugative element protein (TIGR02256 family)
MTAALLDSIKSEATDKFPLETGGVLMGYRLPQEMQVIITDIIGPGPAARHNRTAFLPDQEYQVREIASIYESSGRAHTYLGDWHSHPRGSLAPSARDLTVMANISNTPSARCPEPLLLLAVGGPEWDLWMWQWKTGTKVETVEPLKILPCSNLDSSLEVLRWK